jgi:hypothetical protein
LFFYPFRIDFYFSLKVPFGIVAAGKVHPQPQILLFGIARKNIFLLVGSTINRGCATGLPKSQEAALCCFLCGEIT